ncbi:hypothetical protein BDZ45DRAFT_804809 [Acephala macrosclerotiorum]|nr:hypothetical protein BDZ45DRAFT_804809 [Acephala macrosclerotiorum]
MTARFLRSNKPICEGCRKINYETLNAPGDYGHTMTLAALDSFDDRDPAACPICVVMVLRGFALHGKEQHKPHDSKSDWEVESAKMGSIYSLAIFTIAADWGSSVYSGCYNLPIGKPSPEDDYIEITSELSGGEESSLCFLNTGMGMSGTTAIFSHHPFHGKATILGVLGNDCFPGWFESAIRPSSSGPQSHLYIDIVRRTYSKRESTVESDKLLAISALAELWSKQVKSLYLAGLWQLDIHLGLAWHRDTPFSICRPQNYRNPSWSWAALDCEPVWDWGIHSAYVEPRIQFLEAKIDIGQNPFDRVTGGYIKVVEQMRAFKIEPYRNGAPWNTMRTMDRKEMGYGISAWMDQAQDVQGLLLYEVEEPSDQGDLFRILLLAPNPSDPQQYSRKGLAFVDPSDGLKTLFDGCEKPIITLI